jgi:hypothetical protein
VRMPFIRKRLLVLFISIAQPALTAGTMLLARPAHADTIIPAWCAGYSNNWGQLFGGDSLHWTYAQRVTFSQCLGEDYDANRARAAEFGLDLDRHRIWVESGPGNSEILASIHADFDAAIASVGGTPFYTSPTVWGGSSILEGRRTDPVFTTSLAEVESETPLSPFTGLEDGYSRMHGVQPVSWYENFLPIRVQDLNNVDRGQMFVDPSSRLGAYEATRGYARGTVGHAVHNAIGDIYLLLGTIGQEQIGLIFNSPMAKALFPQPVTSSANLAMATLEYEYWMAVRTNNPSSIGGNAGAAFDPTVRAWLQQHVYSAETPFLRNVPQAPPTPGS